MPPFMSDRRVLATSAAAITAAILLFLIGTYPTWRMAIGVGRLAPEPSDVSGSRAPRLDNQGEQAQMASGNAAQQTTVAGISGSSSPGTAPQSKPQAGEAGSAPAGPDLASSAAPPTDAQKDGGGNAGTTAPSEPSGGADQGPSFDVVRVEPTGDSVVAGRAKPGADIVLLDQGKPIARAKADANGQVAFVPPVLAPGEHSLMLSVGDPGTPGALSSQSVAVSVSAQPTTAPMVALIAPDQPTRLLSNQAATGSSPTAEAGAQAAVPSVSIGAVDVEEFGGVYASGRAAPNSKCRIYLNGSFVAAVTTGRDGTWSLKIKRGMRPGRYTVRVDQVQSAAGQVQARAEVPFDYPSKIAGLASLLRPKASGPGPGALATVPNAQPGSGADAPSAAPNAAMQTASSSGSQHTAPPVQVANADPSTISAPDGTSNVLSQLMTTKVVQGDSLWRISRKMLGHGLRYTQIYAANTAQIRNPKLIYPGQIFVMPQNAP
jgi:nucleoid-associated protein YgaU